MFFRTESSEYVITKTAKNAFFFTYLLSTFFYYTNPNKLLIQGHKLFFLTHMQVIEVIRLSFEH